MKLSIWLGLLLLLTACGKKVDRTPLLENFSDRMSFVKTPNELFGGRCREVRLETTPESLIGKIGKIVKRGGLYFTLSDERQIYQFGGDGQFMSVLSRAGNGPGEYTNISDFEVYESEKGWVICICDATHLKSYLQDEELQWQYVGSIEYPFIVNKFHRISADRILLLAGQKEKSLSLSDGQGKLFGEYLDKEIPFLMFKSVQFVRFKSDIVFQCGVSDSFFALDTTTCEVKEGIITGQSDFLTPENLLDLFDKYQYEYLGHLLNYTCIRTLVTAGNRVLLDYISDGFRYMAVSSSGMDSWQKIKCPVKSGDDLSLAGLFTIGQCDSEDSFLMYRYEEDEDSNPTLIEY